MNEGEVHNLQERIKAFRNDIEQSESFQLETLKLELTEMIYRLMGEMNLSKAALADAIQVSRPYVTKMLRGDINFTINTLYKIATALECRLDVSKLFVPRHSVMLSANSISSTLPDIVSTMTHLDFDERCFNVATITHPNHSEDFGYECRQAA